MEAAVEGEVVLPLSRFAGENVRRNDRANVLFNITVNSAREVPWVDKWRDPHSEEILFVGNAPSIKDSLWDIRRRQKRGAHVWAVNGAHDYLIRHKIIPEAAGFCDPSLRLPSVVTELNDYTTYLPASCCAPAFFDHLAGRNVVLWHMSNEFNEQELVDALGKKYGKQGIIFCGGSTCVLRLPSVAYASGFRKMHFYGVDSSFEGKSHVDRDDTHLFHGGVINVECEGKRFRTNIAMARQCEEFCQLTDILVRGGCHVEVHGKGLLPFRFRKARIR